MPPTRRAAMTQSRPLSAGMERHTDPIQVGAVAHAPDARAQGAEVVAVGRSGTRQGAMAKVLRQLQSKGPPRVCGYAAGPCGSWLARSLTHKGSVCWVVAPSWMPTPPGDRVQTDRR